VTRYLLRRLGQALIVLFLVTFLVFGVMRWLPGDPILMYLSSDKYKITNQAEIDRMRHQYGLDKPIPLQYADWVKGVLTGDLGKSITKGTTVNEELATAVPVTLYLGLVAFVLSQLVGIPLGIYAAIRRGTWIDSTILVVANLGVTAPIFWVGIVLIYVFGVTLGWLPVQGYTSPFVDPVTSIQQLILPAFCLALGPLSGAIRQTRSAMLEVLHQDYVRTAWAKGLTERRVIGRHVVKNGILPVVTLAGMAVPMIIGGAVLVEVVFNIPGMGRLAVNALFAKDYAIVQGIVLITAITVIVANLLVDLSYGYLDPRVRVV
jgi:peptide/nickel transport system permease protein